MFRNNKVWLVALMVIAISVIPVSAATTGSLSLSGTVPAILEITVTPAAGNPNLALDIANGASNLLIANVVERSNKKAGYRVTLGSANSGLLKDGVDPANLDTLGYTLKYDSATVDLSTGSATITSSGSKTSGTGASKPLSISFAGTFLNEGTYSDTLLFTIVSP